MPNDEENQIAVPYIPPPPPTDTSSLKQKKMKSPLVNGILAAVVILLVGFMSYNFIGHELTQLAGVSSERTNSPTLVPPSNTPAPSISVIPSLSVSPSPSY